MSDTSNDGPITTVDHTVTADPIVVLAPADPAPVTTLSPMQVAVGDLTKIVGDETATAEAQEAVDGAVAEEAIAQGALDAAKAKTLAARTTLATAIGQENADVDTAVADVSKLKHG